MGKIEKLIEKILLGGSDANVEFDDLRKVLLSLGFEERQRGSHHVFSKSGLDELVNLQRDGSKARPYQVRQVRTDHPAIQPLEPPMNWKYEVIIYWSNDDTAFVAEVPELPGCMAHGPTQSEALASANDAIELWLATARELGRVVPEPKGRRLLYA